jgi:hypothetical protein
MIFATHPPVQDSAVVIVAPRCFSARPTTSLSCINSWSVIIALAPEKHAAQDSTFRRDMGMR